MKKIINNLKTYFLKNVRLIKDKYKGDKFGLLLFLSTYIVVGVTLLTLPIFTYHQGFTTITNVLSIASALLIVIFLVFRGKFHINYYVIYMFLFVLYSIVLTILTTKDIVFSKTLLTSHAFAVVLFLLFAFTDDYKYFFSLLFASFFILAFYFLAIYIPILLKGGNTIGRLGDELGNVNNVAMTFCFAVIFSLFIIYKYRGKTYFLLIPTALFIACLVLTGSRGAYVTLAIVLIVFLYFFIGRGYFLEFTLALISLVCILILVLQIPKLAPFKSRLSSLFVTLFSLGYSEKSDGSSVTRISMFIDGLRLWAKNIFIGYGISGFRDNTAYPYYSHNTISEVLVDTGLFGGFLFFYPYFRTSILNIKKCRKGPLFFFFSIILLATIVNLFQDIIFYNKISILIWALLAAYTFRLSKKNQFVMSLSLFENKKFKPSFEVHLSESEKKESGEYIKPNIAFVITKLNGGGAERVASILCSEWANLNYNVTLILTSFNQNESQNYPIGKNVDVRTICKHKKLTTLGKIRAIKKILQEKEINICVTFLPNSFILAKFAGIGMQIHHIFSIRINPESNKNLKKNFAYKWSEAIVCQTKEIDEYFDKKGFKKSLIIKNPATSDLVPAKKNNKNKLVAVGRLSDQKNFSLLIESFRLYSLINPKATLTIYGSGEKEQELKAKIINFNLNDKIQILPFASDIKEKINQFGIYCSTSTYEGFSNSMLEAAQAGLPIVSLDCAGGSAKEIIKNNGLILPLSATAGDFCVALDKVNKNYSEYRKYAIDEAIEINKEYNSSSIAQEWIDLFEYILN